MQVSNPNNIKIYNLSAGKSLPEWLSDRKKRRLQQHDIGIQQRIELIQDFEMPTVSNCVQMTKDQQYIYVTGVYKPTVRCYDVKDLSMKFERCLDSDVIKFQILSDDYTKICFLQCDRYFEFHAQGGRYHRLRIPKFGRDLAYHEPSCDMYFVGVSSDIYRFNLDQGRFLAPLKSSASQINCCLFNQHHNLFTCGSSQGQIECWDPRSRVRAGILDCALAAHQHDIDFGGMPSVTALNYRDALQLGVGTNTGHVLLYDIRSNKPLLVKDHYYGLPITHIDFAESQDLVISMDSRIVKLWHRNTGKPYTSIEPGSVLNSMHVVNNSGLMFMANEAPKVLTYYIPALGPAPKWCAFLDNLTEELEESPNPTVYDDYKFVTRTELEELGLAHLIGSNMLRAYMHGFFMDVRLYHRARSITDPFAFEEYRKKKIREKIEEQRKNRVQVKRKLPKVNSMLAEKLMGEADDKSSGKKRKKGHEADSLLKDDRFAAMFTNPEFNVDTAAPEFRLINPLVSKLNNPTTQKPPGDELEQDDDGQESGDADDGSSSSDEETQRRTRDEIKQQHKILRKEEYTKRREEKRERVAQPRLVEVKVVDGGTKGRRDAKISLAERLKGLKSDDSQVKYSSLGNREMTFNVKKRKTEKLNERQRLNKEHQLERKKVSRSAASLQRPHDRSRSHRGGHAR